MSDTTASALPLDRRTPRWVDDPDSPNTGETLGEYFTLEPDDGEMQTEEAPDGGLFVTIGQDYENPQTTSDEFYENLALVLEENGRENILDTMATELLRFIDEDKEVRKKRDEQNEEAIKRSGLGKDAPGGADFEGASRAVHPIIAECSVDFEARVMKEIWPPSGPVKPSIVGTPTKQKTERAKRKVEHMNWQLTAQIKEAYSTLETTLLQSPMGGGAYISQVWDHRLKRPRWSFFPVDKVWLPYSATDFFSSHRMTYAETIPNVEFRQRVTSGMYRDIKGGAPSGRPEETKSERASAKVEGKSDPGFNLDGDREIYTCKTLYEITPDMAEILGVEEEGQLYPYIVMIDGGEAGSHKIVGIYRNWEEKDETREALDHLYEIPFIPWPGGYSIGLAQLIGTLSGAATGALRAMLDAAFVRTTPGGLILKGSGTSGTSKHPRPGEFTEIDGGGLESSDIKDKVMTFPVAPADPTLFQLLGFVIEAGKGVVRTTLEQTPENMSGNVPVGTQLSRVEEGLVVFQQIHGRVHNAFNRILVGLHRLNRLYLPKTLRVDAEGKEILVWRRDYEGPLDVRPVSDPTIFSEQQRAAQDAGILQRATQVPQLYKARAVEERWLRRQKIGDDEIKELLADQPQPHELNQVNECLAMCMGQPVVVFPEQDHLAHLETLSMFMQSPVLGGSPILAPKFLPAAVQHGAQHIAYLFVAIVHGLVSRTAGMDAELLLSNDDRVKRKLDQLLAAATQVATKAVEQAVGPMMPLFTNALQQVQAMQPKPPMDPATAAVQASLAETQRKTSADRAGHAIDSAELSSKNALQQQEIAQGWAKIQALVNSAATAAQTKIQTTAMDNDTAQQISSDRLASGREPGYSTGESMEGG